MLPVNLVKVKRHYMEQIKVYFLFVSVVLKILIKFSVMTE